MKRLICLAMAALMLFVFAACVQDDSDEEIIDFNAVMYDRAVLWRNDEFYKDNLTWDWGVSYYEDNGEYLLADETCPNSRTFIINNQDNFENIFAEFPPGIDFESEMLLLHIFTNVGNGLHYGINKVSLNDGIVKIDFELLVPAESGPWASMPIVRWLAVKMNKFDITQAEFEERPTRYV